MKVKKKLIIGTALLAVVGGLAGCGAQHKSATTQQKAQRTSVQKPKENKLEKQQDTYAKLMNADGKLPSSDNKYNDGIQPKFDTLCVTIQQPTQVANEEDSNSPIIQKRGYNVHKQVNQYWHDLRSQLKKNGGAHMEPLPVIFLFVHNLGGETGGNTYGVAYGKTNDSHLHNLNMKLVKPRSTNPNQSLDDN